MHGDGRCGSSAGAREVCRGARRFRGSGPHPGRRPGQRPGSTSGAQVTGTRRPADFDWFEYREREYRARAPEAAAG